MVGQWNSADAVSQWSKDLLDLGLSQERSPEAVRVEEMHENQLSKQKCSAHRSLKIKRPFRCCDRLSLGPPLSFQMIAARRPYSRHRCSGARANEQAA